MGWCCRTGELRFRLPNEIRSLVKLRTFCQSASLIRLFASSGRLSWKSTAKVAKSPHHLKGNCWDACSETLFGSLKVERLHGQRVKTKREAKDEIVAWLLWYNRARLHSTLAYASPM